MIWLVGGIAVALLIASHNGGSPGRLAHLESPHPFLTQVKATIDPLTHWQPRSGQIRIAFESTGKANLADTNLSVYFRWRTKSNSGEWVRTPNLHVVDLQNAQKLTVAAQVPEMPDAPPNGCEPGFPAVATGSENSWVWFRSPRSGFPHRAMAVVLTRLWPMSWSRSALPVYGLL
jgi:hypothetical protein